MHLRLDYGKKGIEAEIPAEYQTIVLDVKGTPPLADPKGALRENLSSPLGTEDFTTLCQGVKTACIVVSDKTRPVPNKVILPPLLEILDRFSVKTKILIACGMHAPTTGDDLTAILGRETIKEYEVINHDAYEENDLVSLGENGAQVPIDVNRTYYEADLKILTGFIEPHFMAGFSGGRKSICPGISGIETIKYFHSPQVLESALAKNGILAGNPCNEFAVMAAERAGCGFIVNVTLNPKKEITGIFCGDLKTAYSAGVNFCAEEVSAHIDQPVDVVVTSGGGYPLDRDFYQTVKGIVGALDIIKDGGTIIIASECSDGIGSREFKDLLFNMTDIDVFMEMITQSDYFCVDQWEVEELIKALRRCKIKLYSENLIAAEIKRCWCDPVDDLNETISKTIKAYGEDARLAVIPSGPYILGKVVEGG